MDAAVASGDLLRSARGGDAAAFGLLLDPLWEPAYRLAFSMLRDRDAAEDAVQEAALKAWRGVRRLRSDTSSLRPWFLTVVANQCRSARRSPWWRVLRLSDLPAAEERREVSAEERADLGLALRKLPPHHREVLALRYFLDLPIDEVAQILGISLPAAKSRIQRALKALEPALRAIEDTA